MDEKSQKVAEKAKKTRERPAKPGTFALKRQFPRTRAGVIVVTCIKNRKSYIARSKDVEYFVWHIQKKLRYSCWCNEEMQRDYNLYGKQFFRFGLIDSWEYIGDEIEEVWKQVEMCWETAQIDMKPAYNRDKVLDRKFLRRNCLALLGSNKRAVGQHMMPLRSWNPRGIFVLTCKKNQRQFVGSTTHFQHTIKDMLRYLRRGKRNNPALREDYLKFGENAFLIEFCELPDASDAELRDARKKVQSRLKPYYNEAGEKERCKDFVANFKGATGRRPAPGKEKLS